jgi:hypothetical protein
VILLTVNVSRALDEPAVFADGTEKPKGRPGRKFGNMRFLVLPLMLLVIALLIYLMLSATRGPSQAERAKAARRAGWTTATEMKDGHTIVLVRQMAEIRGAPVELARQVIAQIPDGVPDWETRYREAMAEARIRVSTLEIESDG